MSEFIAYLRPARLEMLTEGPTPQESELTSQHFAYWERLLAQGALILAGRTQDASAEGFGIIIFRAENEAAARQIVDNDPGIRGGLMRVRLHPYRVALMEGR